MTFANNRYLCVMINISGTDWNAPVAPFNVTGFQSTNQPIFGMRSSSFLLFSQFEGVRWNLMAAVEHAGEYIKGGHYRAWVRAPSNSGWCIAEDSNERLGPLKLKKNLFRLYVLFFERAS